MCYAILKRLLDLVVCIPVLVVLLPLSLIIGIWIRLDSRGPAVFRQERAGRNGKPFIMYKFRTMRQDVDPFGNSPKDGQDPRLTKSGRFLRETSLDELPQLLNVLKGEMSLVGPRPLYVSQMTEWNQRQRQRLNVKPGLTGKAQISGRGQLTIEDKLELDVQYVEQASLGLDVAILWKTFCQVFSKQDIYEGRYSATEETRQKR